MNFVYPEFLWAYFLVSVPIIVHLFNFRRYKNVYFSRVKYLKEVTEDSRSGVKLKHLLVLFSRILTILCLVTAFAQPYIPTGNQENTENVTSIYIDNSYSMQALGQDGDLLNEVKNQAIELVKSLEENEKVNLITSDLLSIHQRFYTKGEIVDMIKALELSPKSTNLGVVLNTQIDLLLTSDENEGTENANHRIFVFSDFQQSTSDLSEFKRDEIQAYFYKAKSEIGGNIFIDSVWFETPVHRLNSPIDLHFRIRNVSDIEDSLSVTLDVGGNEHGPKKIGVAPHSFTDSKINFTDREPGIKSCVLRIGTSQLFFDDEMYFTYEIKEKVNILLVKNSNDDNINIEQLYSLDPYYNCQTTTIDVLTQQDFKDKELIILQNIVNIPSGIKDLIDESLNNGSSAILIPGVKAELDNWNSYLLKHDFPTLTRKDSSRQDLTYFNSDDPLYTGVFESTPKSFQFPEVYGGYNLNVTSTQNFVTLFGVNQSIPFLLYGKRSNGKMILMSSPLKLNYTNFQNHALFAATFLRFAETATFQKPIYMTIGEMYNYPLNREIDDKKPIHLKKEDDKVDVIPQVINTATTRAISFAHLEDHLKNAGFYELTDGKDFYEIIGLNFSRKESYIETFSAKEVKEEFSSTGWKNAEKLEQTESGQIEIIALKAKEYWRILLILGLIFIAAEILLLKLWKT